MGLVVYPNPPPTILPNAAAVIGTGGSWESIGFIVKGGKVGLSGIKGLFSPTVKT